MTDHDVDSVVTHEADQITGISLHAPDAAAQAGVRRPSVERSESVGTGVDHHDFMALARQQGRQATRPATEVDDLEGAELPRDKLADLRLEQLQQETLRHRTTAPQLSHRSPSSIQGWSGRKPSSA